MSLDNHVNIDYEDPSFFGIFDEDEYETLVCKKCGKEYKMRPQLENRDSISPIIWKQYKKGFCDRCFVEWYKAYSATEEED